MEQIASGEEIVTEWDDKCVVQRQVPRLKNPCGQVMQLSSQFGRDETKLYSESVSTWSLIAEIRVITDPQHM